ncbi:MAG: hypothetical protein CVU56_23100 [Deltaproteobacteria bacterium HGW-Deltaproteobacteria-14]|jgi:hypothetical protein|nr:MAG: hypothetical protein CVU56_23100 [Deltaproteobacteria bacterium HGW-Deltaproteobacteria-14]
MEIGDPNEATYIAPDPITARITNKGARMMSIAAGLGLTGDGFLYQVPDPFAEVFDGIAVGNTDFDDLDAYLEDHSDGSATIAWQDAGGQPVMRATFVHGSPYADFKAYQVVYNFTVATQSVTYSDGHAVTAAPRGFTITTSE